MASRLIQRAVRKGAGRFVPSFLKRTFKPLLSYSGKFDNRLLELGVDAIRPDDCFLASYPRSGNTWLRFILASLLAPDQEISFQNIDRLIPDPERVTFDVETLPSPRIIKSHWPYFELFPKCVYLVRDPRDVFVSFYHYCQKNGWFSGDLDSFSGFRPIYGDWADHVELALRFAEESPNRFLWLKYEDMLSEPIVSVQRVASFLNFRSSSEEIGRAIDRNSLALLRAKERTCGPERNTPPGFFRTGKSGQWRDELPLKQLDWMQSEYRSLLVRLGYDII